MAIGVCEFCGKPFNSVGSKLCVACTKMVDDTYIKVRKYIYQNSKDCEFITIVEETGVSEKALNYLIKKGRIEVANKTGGGPRCRACGKETSGGAICDQCMAKIIAEKLTSESKRSADPSSLKKTILPKSFTD